MAPTRRCRDFSWFRRRIAHRVFIGARGQGRPQRLPYSEGQTRGGHGAERVDDKDAALRPSVIAGLRQADVTAVAAAPESMFAGVCRLVRTTSACVWRDQRGEDAGHRRRKLPAGSRAWSCPTGCPRPRRMPQSRYPARSAILARSALNDVRGRRCFRRWSMAITVSRRPLLAERAHDAGVEADRPSFSTTMMRRCDSKTANPSAVGALRISLNVWLADCDSTTRPSPGRSTSLTRSSLCEASPR
jgi:hypothetical protein